MTDRELLELAAKAAGIQYSVEDEEYYKNHAFFGLWLVYDGEPSEYAKRYWNPLTDDGDALRLLTKLPFCELYVSEIGATVSWRRSDGSGHGLKCDEYADEHGGDLQAATRRAIVRAAAEIGRAVQKPLAP